MHEGHPQNWQKHPGSEWAEEYFRCLEELGLKESKHTVRLRDLILQSVALTYWQSLLSYAERSGRVRKRGDEFIERTIGRHLGVNEGTISRWLNNKISPGPDKVFGTLVVVLRSEIDEVGFPGNREVVQNAVARTVSVIREEDIGRGPGTAVVADLAAAFWLLRHPDSEVFTSRYTSSGDREVSERKQAVYAHVLRKVRRQCPQGGFASTRALSQSIVEWTRPYLLFYMGLRKGWEFLDDEAIGAIRGPAASER